MVQSAMKDEGKKVSIKKLCKWFKTPRSSFYYKSLIISEKPNSRTLNKQLSEQIRQAIEENPEPKFSDSPGRACSFFHYILN